MHVNSDLVEETSANESRRDRVKLAFNFALIASTLSWVVSISAIVYVIKSMSHSQISIL